MFVEEHTPEYHLALRGARRAETDIATWLAGDPSRVLMPDTVEQQFPATVITEADVPADAPDKAVALLNLREGYVFAVRAAKHLIQQDDHADHEWWLTTYEQWVRLAEHYMQEADWVVAEINRAHGIEQIHSWVKRKYETGGTLIVDLAFCETLIATPQIDLEAAHAASLELHTFTCRDELETGWVLAANVLRGLTAEGRTFQVVGADTYRVLNITWTAQISLVWRRS